LTSYLVELLDRQGGRTHGHRPGGNIAANHGVGADDGAATDRYGSDNHCIVADPDVVADDYRSSSSQIAKDGGSVGVTLLGAAVLPVMMVSDVDSAADENIMPYVDSLDARDVDAFRKRDSIPDRDRGEKVLMIQSRYGVQPEMTLGINIGSEANEAGSNYSASRAQIQSPGIKHPAQVRALQFRRRAPEKQP
jgi:hypothetical protein